MFTSRPFLGRRLGRAPAWLLCALGAVSIAAAAGTAVRHWFDIPAGDAVKSLRLFARQSNEQIVYPVEQVRGCRTRPVQGELTAAEALEAMLTGSGLRAVRDRESGAFTVRRRPAGERETKTPPPPARPETRADANGAGKNSDEVVSLSPFDVRSNADHGYRAANSVAATRMAVPIRQLPIAISAFTGAFIEDQRAYDLYDVIKWAPGVHQDNVSPQGWVRYNIRGYTSAAVQRNGFESFRFIDTANIERVEVVKGPSSLLYGQINPGGVINYVPKEPEEKPAVRTSVSVGTQGYDRELFDATGPVSGSDGRLLYRLIAMREDIQQFQQRASGQKSLLAPSVVWRAGRNASLKVDLERFDRRDRMPTSGVVLRYVNGAATVPYPGLPWNFSYAGEGDYQNFASTVVTAEFNARLNPHASVSAAYSNSSWDMEWRATGQGATGLLPQSFIDYYYPASAGLTPADAMYRRNRWEHQWGGEQSARIDVTAEFEWAGIKFRPLVGWKGTPESHFRWLQRNNPNVAGSPFYLRPWDLRDPATWDLTVPFGRDALVPIVDNQNSSRSSSEYVVVSITACDERLHVLGGYAHHALHNNAAYDHIAGTVTDPTDRAADVPQFGVLYAFTSSISGFANYSKSFLANSSTLRVNNVPKVPAAPSLGRGVEAGVKVELIEGRLSGMASIYQVTASPTGITSYTTGVDASGVTLFSDIQGGKQRSRGAEMDLLYTPVDGLQVIAGYSYCDAVYVKHPITAALDGSRLPATPDQTLSLWGKYSLETGPLRGVSLGGGLNYVGSVAHIANNPGVETPPYTTIDVSIGYRFCAGGRKWNTELLVKNVADQHYYPSATSWGFPRHAMLTVSTQF